MYLKHINGKNLFLKKMYEQVVTCFILNNKKEKILDKDHNNKQLYNVKGEPIYKKGIFNKKNILEFNY